MSYYLLSNTEKQTRKFFRKKYGFFWKRKINPKKKDWILVDEYLNKFKEFLKDNKEKKK